MQNLALVFKPQRPQLPPTDFIPALDIGLFPALLRAHVLSQAKLQRHIVLSVQVNFTEQQNVLSADNVNVVPYGYVAVHIFGIDALGSALQHQICILIPSSQNTNQLAPISQCNH